MRFIFSRRVVLRVATALAVALAIPALAIAVDGNPKAGDTNGSSRDQGWVCNQTTGLARPIPSCSEKSPCVRVAPELPQAPITEPLPVPDCKEPGRFDDGPPFGGWTDLDGATRFACLYRPAATRATPIAPSSAPE